MKKRLVPRFALALVLVATAAVQAITVTSPNGGESWPLGAMRPITWTAEGIGGSDTPTTVSILLVRNGSKLGLIAENVPLATGSFPWTVGQYQGGTAPAGSGYSVIVSGSTGGEDVSNAPFTITSGPGLPPPPPPVMLKLTAPNGGESWRLGSAQTISWTSTNLAGQVQLELVRPDGGLVGVIASGLPAAGSRPWNAGDHIGGRVTAGDYLVRARSQAQPARQDESDGTFHLLSALVAGPAGPAGPATPVTHPAFPGASWERIPATITNWGGKDAFPPQYQIPLDVIRARPVCDPGLANVHARVGRDWFEVNPGLQYAHLLRSRVTFEIGPYRARAGELQEARLRLKQTSSLRTGTNDASCGSNACDLLGPWTAFDQVQLGDCHLLNTNQTSYTVDVTETVRKWLNGSLPNHGIVLFAREAPMSNPWTCISCCEVTFELRF
ncbi:MAG: GPI anchored serine-threonine rich family protein [Thermoanaerobaculia bacterium]|nr:GPI anchored serine-threonine rich family protein [Thermoanaerobaculia bacterium]